MSSGGLELPPGDSGREGGPAEPAEASPGQVASPGAVPPGTVTVTRPVEIGAELDWDAEDWGEENKRIIDYFTRLLADESNPLLMRATQGLYPPGSTFKTISAAAAVDTNTAQPSSIFTDTDGTIKVEPGDYVHVEQSRCT